MPCSQNSPTPWPTRSCGLCQPARVRQAGRRRRPEVVGRICPTSSAPGTPVSLECAHAGWDEVHDTVVSRLAGLPAERREAFDLRLDAWWDGLVAGLYARPQETVLNRIDVGAPPKPLRLRVLFAHWAGPTAKHAPPRGRLTGRTHSTMMTTHTWVRRCLERLGGTRFVVLTGQAVAMAGDVSLCGGVSRHRAGQWFS